MLTRLILSGILFGLLGIGTLLFGFLAYLPHDPPCTVTMGEPPYFGPYPFWVFPVAAFVFMFVGRFAIKPSSNPIRGRDPHLIVGAPKTSARAARELDAKSEPPTIGAASAGAASGMRGVVRVARQVWPALLLQFSIWVFLLISGVALIYETVAVAGNDNPWPITQMVRCINSAASVQTLIITAVVSFVIGSWLLFRDDDKGRTSGRR